LYFKSIYTPENAFNPPSADSITPVIKRARSDNRKSVGPARSSGLPNFSIKIDIMCVFEPLKVQAEKCTTNLLSDTASWLILTAVKNGHGYIFS